MDPLTIALLGATALGVIGNVHSAKKAQKFSEKMSNTAHQREVADLEAAGLNPMLSAHGSGASSPQGVKADIAEGAEKGISTALMVKQARAQTELLEAQGAKVRQETAQSGASTQLTHQQTMDLIMQGGAGKYELIREQVVGQQISNERQQQLTPLILQKAQAEIGATLQGTARAKALTALDELARTGAMNEEQFEDTLGNAGRWTRLMFELMREIRGR